MPSLQPGGITPASAFDPDPIVVNNQPPLILADKLDDDTGEFADLLVGEEPIDAAVAYTFKVERGTGAAARNHGHRFRDLRHQDELSEATVESLAEEAVQHLVNARLVRLERTTLDAQEGDAGDATVVFRNLFTGREIPTAVPE